MKFFLSIVALAHVAIAIGNQLEANHVGAVGAIIIAAGCAVAALLVRTPAE